MKYITIFITLIISGCASHNEVPACTWNFVDPEQINIKCGDYSGKTNGCQTGSTTCDLWIRNDLIRQGACSPIKAEAADLKSAK